MTGLTTRQQAVRSGRARRINDPISQQRLLHSLGISVALEDLRALPPGAWIRYAPEDAPLRLGRRRARR